MVSVEQGDVCRQSTREMAGRTRGKRLARGSNVARGIGTSDLRPPRRDRYEVADPSIGLDIAMVFYYARRCKPKNNAAPKSLSDRDRQSKMLSIGKTRSPTVKKKLARQYRLIRFGGTRLVQFK
jgi:hypothetical protein